MKIHTFRLTTGQDLRSELENFVRANGLKAGFVITCVGSLNPVMLRMSGAQPEKQDIRTYEGDFEIVSLVGTVSMNGSHLHLAVSDREGHVFGGHLKEGSIVHTTAEIVLGEDTESTYTRELDDQTGFPELVVRPK